MYGLILQEMGASVPYIANACAASALIAEYFALVEYSLACTENVRPQSKVPKSSV